MAPVHGQFDISRKDNILQIRFIGSFNEFGIKAACFELRQVIEAFNGATFLLISNYSGVEGATPEAFDEIAKHNQWMSQRNIIAKAIITTSETIKNIGLRRVPQGDINSKFFKCENQATQWLIEQELAFHGK
tara:strand:+ start:4582 stop:4977 length:396 start_codon:yes stop_codon:yes gene_type:complete